MSIIQAKACLITVFDSSSILQIFMQVWILKETKHVPCS